MPQPLRKADPVLFAALGIDTAIAVIDSFTSVVLLSLLVFGPLVAATRATTRQTAGVALYAVVLALYEGIPHDFFGTADHLLRCLAVAATGGLAVWVAHVRGRREESDAARAGLLVRERAARRDAVAAGERQQRIADTLQRSLVPERLPEPPGFAIAARFRPAGDGDEVGGDFYDAFRMKDGRSAVVIGDVVRKGAGAAAMTALARHTVRTAAAVGEGRPSELLSLLNRVVLAEPSPDRLCTVACCVMEEAHTRIEVASAGHPLPVLLRSTGEVESVGRPGTMLGVLPDAWLFDEATDLHPGDALVFYTDGVSEARTATGLLGHDRVAGIVAGCRGSGPERIAERLERAVLDVQEGEPRDDVAVLVVQREAAASPRQGGEEPRPAEVVG